MPGKTATASGTSGVPVLLKATVVAALVLPANMVFDPLGAVGFPAMIVALLLFATWGSAIVWRAHDPTGFRHPARIGLTLFWLATVVSYLRMSNADSVQRAAADRWILSLLAMTALVLVTAESVRTMHDAVVLARVISIAASISAGIAIYQFTMGTDPLDLVRSVMIGMTDNGGGTTFQARGLLTRVAGNTFTPIELGVVTAMVLPLAVWRALNDERGRTWIHWVQCGAIAFASVITVSRSAILGLAVAAMVTVPFLPRHARRWAAIVIPFVVVGLFVAVPGLIATLRTTLLADSNNDPSLATRVNNYPRVQAMIVERPWFGIGPSTYSPSNALEILDNQYLHTAVEMGMPGLLALIVLFLCPIVAALSVALWTRDQHLKLLAAVSASGCAVAAAGSAVFDSLSFPVFIIIFPIFVGLTGSVWMMARRTPDRDSAPPGPLESRTELVTTSALHSERG
ncbi:MAG: O-antigen ligase family protein [Rhodococcus sp. (in: high G+C Gram-positive bacteria)]